MDILSSLNVYNSEWDLRTSVETKIFSPYKHILPTQSYYMALEDLKWTASIIFL